jgi:hypothetical protein
MAHVTRPLLAVLVLCLPLSSARAQPTPSAPERPAVVSDVRIEEYGQRRIGFDEIVKVNKKTGETVFLRSTPFEGWNRKPLKGDAFYLKVDRPDLASAYQRRVTIKIAAGIVGGAAVLSGGVLTLLTGAQGDYCTGGNPAYYNTCLSRNLQIKSERTQRTRLGLSLIGAGGIFLTLAVGLNSHPITPNEAHKLADSYNERLKVELGVSHESLPWNQARTP